MVAEEYTDKQPTAQAVPEMWDVHAQVRQLIDTGDYAGALTKISTYREQCFGTFSPLFVLEADCVARAGRPESYARAIAILEEAAGFDRNNFWIYYALARYLRLVGRSSEAHAASWEAHRSVGWSESGEKGYEFTDDWFSAEISKWAEWFSTLITNQPVYCLEIGSWQGISATWLLDKVVAPRGGHLTCIDRFTGSSEHAALMNGLEAPLEELFDRNIAKTGRGSLCRKLVGYSHHWLRRLPYESYDFIYVDGAHEAKFVIQDAVLAAPLLKPDGFLLFDDADFRFAEDPIQNTENAIEFFRNTFGDEFECIDRGRQVLFRKVS